MGILDQILDSTRHRIALLEPERANLVAMSASQPTPRPFQAALETEGLSVIAEVKRKSPSRGVLASALDPSLQAVRYETGGAAAVSVLTEPHFFAGSNADLREVKKAVSIPVLRKDFMVHELQLHEARVMGADAVLLIVAALTQGELSHLVGVADSLGLGVLVEVHNSEEVEIALSVKPHVVGVNNRNLTTFEVSLETAEALVSLLEGVAVTVGESGIHTSKDAQRMSNAGFDAVLVGEALVKCDDPAALIRSFGATP